MLGETCAVELEECFETSSSVHNCVLDSKKKHISSLSQCESPPISTTTLHNVIAARYRPENLKMHSGTIHWDQSASRSLLDHNPSISIGIEEQNLCLKKIRTSACCFFWKKVSLHAHETKRNVWGIVVIVVCFLMSWLVCCGRCIVQRVVVLFHRPSYTFFYSTRF